MALTRHCSSVSVVVLFIVAAVALLNSASTLQRLGSVTNHKPAQEHQEDDDDDERSNVTLVPFPYLISMWSGKGNQFYHTMQCVFTGFTVAGIDPVQAARHPEDFRFCANLDMEKHGYQTKRGQQQQPPPLIHRIEESFWNISKRYSYDDCLKLNQGQAAGWNKNFLEKMAWSESRACGVYNSINSNKWLGRYLEEKENNSPLMPSDNVSNVWCNENWNNNNASSSPSQAMSTAIKGLLMNRPKKRHVPEHLMDRILEIPGVDWTYSPNMAAESILNQFRLFRSHPLVVLPHGAAQFNLMATIPWTSSPTPSAPSFPNGRRRLPTTVIELCTPYLHCPCLGICQQFFQVRFPYASVWGIALEHPNLTCTQFCDSKYKRFEIKDANLSSLLPTKEYASAIQGVIQNDIIPKWRRYCSDGTFEKQPLQNSTTMTRIVSYKVPMPTFECGLFGFRCWR